MSRLTHVFIGNLYQESTSVNSNLLRHPVQWKINGDTMHQWHRLGRFIEKCTWLDNVKHDFCKKHRRKVGTAKDGCYWMCATVMWRSQSRHRPVVFHLVSSCCNWRATLTVLHNVYLYIRCVLGLARTTEVFTLFFWYSSEIWRHSLVKVQTVEVKGAIAKLSYLGSPNRAFGSTSVWFLGQQLATMSYTTALYC